VANRFGFPAPEVVARWQTTGARVLRTDERGAVIVRLAPDGSVHTRTHITATDAP
jgi:competence protein ComEC